MQHFLAVRDGEPVGRITAIDLNAGDHAWMSPHGDGPRNHPALKALNLPALGGHSGINAGGPLVTKTLLIVNSGGRYVTDQAEGARTMTAYHKDTGEYLGSVTLPAVPYGNPMTYLHDGRQYIVVAVGGGGGAAAPAGFCRAGCMMAAVARRILSWGFALAWGLSLCAGLLSGNSAQARCDVIPGVT